MCLGNVIPQWCGESVDQRPLKGSSNLESFYIFRVYLIHGYVLGEVLWSRSSR